MRSAPPQPEETPSGKPLLSGKAGISAVLLVVAGVIAYANSIHGLFIFDDLLSIVENPDIRRFWPPWPTDADPLNLTVKGRPVVQLSMSLNHALGGLDVRGYHVVNIAIHILAALVLFGIVRRTLGVVGSRVPRTLSGHADGIALASALLWLVHPLQTECVNYISQRSESLMGLFYLLTLYCAIRGIGEGRRWTLAAVLCCALGMASKQVMVTAPLMVVIYDVVFGYRNLREAMARRWRLYAGLASTWIVLGVLMWRFPDTNLGIRPGVGPLGYLMNQCLVVLDYLRLVVWPHPLALDYGYARELTLGQVAPQGLLLATLVAGSVALLLRRPAVGFLCTWCFVILAPTSSLVPMTTSVGAERRMYLPLAGVIVLVVCVGILLLERAGGRRRLAPVLVLLVATALTAATIARNQDYDNAVLIWTSAVSARPQNQRGQFNLGVALRAEGRIDEAKHRYRRALEVDPDYTDANYNLANLLAAEGATEEAVAHYRRALEAESDHADAHNNLGAALASMGRLDEAIRSYRAAVRADPAHADALNNLGVALAASGDANAAVRRYREALDVNPDHANARFNLATILEARGMLDEAIGHYEAAARIAPDPGKLEALAAAYAAAGRFDDAVETLESALALAPAGERTDRLRHGLEQYRQRRERGGS